MFSQFKPAKLVNVIMAQPIQIGAPSFCLSVFGTDNKFTGDNVITRWDLIQQKLSEVGIKIVGISSDGDSRLLKAMRHKNKLPCINNYKLPAEWSEFFFADFDSEISCIQDPTHIGTKLRNRILNTKKLLILGDEIVSINHLTILVKQEPKSDHFLTMTDIDGSDRMNFQSVQKMMDEKVVNCLERKIPGSKGTILFLKIMRYSVISIMDPDMKPSKRIYYIWLAVFILRIWRGWIIKRKDYDLGTNFVTYNAYVCIELNAHSLVRLAIQLSSLHLEHLFLPFLYNSQTCEAFFRNLRSMTTTNSTVVNFSLRDVIFRIRRVSFQTEVINKLGDKYNFVMKTNTSGTKFASLPNEDEIFQIIKKAKAEAVREAMNVGISLKEDEIYFHLNNLTGENEDSEEEEDNILIENIEKIDIASGSVENIINEEDVEEEDENLVDNFDFMTIKKYEGLKNLKKFQVIEGQFSLLLVYSLF